MLSYFCVCASGCEMLTYEHFLKLYTKQNRLPVEINSNCWYTHMHYLGSFYLFILFAKSVQIRLGITQKNVICKNNKNTQQYNAISVYPLTFCFSPKCNLFSSFHFFTHHYPLMLKWRSFASPEIYHCMFLLDSVLSCLPWSCSLNLALPFLTLKDPFLPADKYLLMIPLYKMSLTLSVPEALVLLFCFHLQPHFWTKLLHCLEYD